MMKLAPFFSHTNNQISSYWADENISQNNVLNKNEWKSKIISGDSS